MTDEDSSSTSCDDKSEFNENPTRDALAEGLMSFLKPRIDNMYKAVENVKRSQLNLKSELDGVFIDLDQIFKDDDDKVSSTFQTYADKIAEMKHQMTVIENVLQSARGRLENVTGKMHALQKSKRAHFDEFALAKQNAEQK